MNKITILHNGKSISSEIVDILSQIVPNCIRISVSTTDDDSENVTPTKDLVNDAAIVIAHYIDMNNVGKAALSLIKILNNTTPNHPVINAMEILSKYNNVKISKAIEKKTNLTETVREIFTKLYYHIKDKEAETNINISC